MTRLRKPSIAIMLMAAAGTAACGGSDGNNNGSVPVAGSGGNRGTGGRTGGGTGGSPAGTGGGTAGAPGGGGAPGSGGGSAVDGGGMGGSAGAAGDGGSAAMPTADGDYGFTKKPVPVLWITIGVGAEKIAAPGLPKAMRTPGTVKVIENHDGSAITDIAGKPVALEAPILMEGRGSSSYGLLGNPPFNGQRNYGIEFHDGQRNAVGQVLLGMPKNADWALVPCFTEKTCLRNAVTYAYAREIAAPGRWAPRFRWAEVYIDGKYWGLYTVTEKIKDDKFRVNLPKAPMGAPPAEHGYMISANGDARSVTWDPLKPEDFLDVRGAMTGAPPTATTPAGERKRRWKWREPSDASTTPAMRTYLIDSFDKMQAALEMGSPGWKDLIDIPSWVDYMVVAEFSNNVDAFFKSWYLYKNPQSVMGGKWFMGPVWDFDLGYGNVNYHMRLCTSNSRIGPLSKQPPAAALAADYDLPPPPWVLKPLQDPAVRDSLRCRWNELRKTGSPLDVAKLEQWIDDFGAHIKPAIARHTARWMNLNTYIWPNNYVGATWEDEVKFLKFWMRKRLAWVDSKLPGMCAATPAPSAVMQLTAPPSVKVDRNKEGWAGEAKTHYTDYLDPGATAPPEWACPQ